jgi:heptosyltransferase-2
MALSGAAAPERIVVRAPTWVGDAVMATPALRALRAAHPRAHIAVEGRPAIGDLLHGLASIDAYLPLAGRGARGIAARAAALSRAGFDWAVLLPDSPRAALGPFLARLPRRVGYARDPLRRAMLTDVLPPPSENGARLPIPMVERYLRITRHLGCADRGGEVELAVDAGARACVDAALRPWEVGAGERLLVVTPGAGFGPSKLWPPEHFAHACRLLHARFGLRPVVAPAPDELGLARRIAERAREAGAFVFRCDAAPGLAALKALIERASLVLSNDTGPRHVAVALGIPVVVLMGPTDPRHTACNLENQRVLREDVACSPCQKKICPIDHRCLARLHPERVVAAAEELLAAPRA